jgi:hypothetical protein
MRTASEIALAIALRMLHAGRLRLLEEILDEAEHGHTTAMWAYDEFQHMANDTDRARALREFAEAMTDMDDF